MRETIFLIVDQRGVQAMRKSLPDVRRGEIPVKITLNVPKEAFAPPTLSQEITVNDWRQGIELSDVEFRNSVITPQEAEEIRKNRLAKMKTVLESQGYQITEPIGGEAK